MRKENYCLEYELPAPTASFKIHARAAVRFYKELSRWQGGNLTDIPEIGCSGVRRGSGGDLRTEPQSLTEGEKLNNNNQPNIKSTTYCARNNVSRAQKKHNPTMWTMNTRQIRREYDNS